MTIAKTHCQRLHAVAGLLCLALAGAPGPLSLQAQGAVLYVSADSPVPAPPYDAWSNAAHTVQAAVDHASDGDSIQIAGGTHTECGILVGKPLTISGMGMSNTVVQAAPTLAESTNRVFHVTADGCRLAGMTIRHGTGGEGGGVWFEGDDKVPEPSDFPGRSGLAAFRAAYAAWLARLPPTIRLEACELRDNRATDGGGLCAYGFVAEDCVFAENEATSRGGGVALAPFLHPMCTGLVVRCAFEGNRAYAGGGACDVTEIRDSVFLSNVGIQQGGGYGRWDSHDCLISGCTFIGNESGREGGAIYHARVEDCVVRGNRAMVGGGLFWCHDVRRTLIEGNFAEDAGGGAYDCYLYACAVVGNVSGYGAGGVGGYHIGESGDSRSHHGEFVVDHCTIVGNRAAIGGGVSGGWLTNSIVWHNTATIAGAECYDPLSASHCCSSEGLAGDGNITNAPVLSGSWRLGAGSPCLGAGVDVSGSAVDLDGEPWGAVPAIGCDEPALGAMTGLLSVAVSATPNLVAVGHGVALVGRVEGVATSSCWSLGDGTVVGNQPYLSHAWEAPGTYDVVLTACNLTYPEGLSATTQVAVVERPVHYADAACPTPRWPYDAWTNAATNLQDAVDAATTPGSLVLVADGEYASGGRAAPGCGLTNRVCVTNAVEVRSVNGAQTTRIVGVGVVGTNAVRCAHLGAGARLVGFTLTSGGTHSRYSLSYEDAQGGAVSGDPWAEVSHCIVVGNRSESVGGVVDVSVRNSLLLGNDGYPFTGGKAVHCTIVGNGYGVTGCHAKNCIIRDNGGVIYDPEMEPWGYDWSCVLDHCCTFPEPDSSDEPDWWDNGNIAVAPNFVDPASLDYRLRVDSPCIDAGSAADGVSGTDLDGNPRIVELAPDIGAYEFILSPDDYDGDGLSNHDETAVWGTSPTRADSDGDGPSDGDEATADTDPLNASCLLRILDIQHVANGMQVTWQGGEDAWQYLEICEDITSGSPQWFTVHGVRPPTPPTNVVVDPAPEGVLFYRIRAERR